MNTEIQHEFDNEPTYIVDKDTDQELVKLDASLPWQLRKAIAAKVKDMLTPPKKYEAVKEEGSGNWCVKSKQGRVWYTICETFAFTPLGNAQENAILIAEMLNARHEKNRQPTKKEQ